MRVPCSPAMSFAPLQPPCVISFGERAKPLNGILMENRTERNTKGGAERRLEEMEKINMDQMGFGKDCFGM